MTKYRLYFYVIHYVSCWQNERQIGIVLLIIQDRLDLPEDATYIITLLSYAAIALVVIIFVCNVIASRQRERT